MLHCLPDSAWADGNLAEAAGQVGGPQKSKSTQPRSQLTWDTLYININPKVYSVQTLLNLREYIN